jgi:hypothetical protein
MIVVNKKTNRQITKKATKEIKILTIYFAFNTIRISKQNLLSLNDLWKTTKLNNGD